MIQRLVLACVIVTACGAVRQAVTSDRSAGSATTSGGGTATGTASGTLSQTATATGTATSSGTETTTSVTSSTGTATVTQIGAGSCVTETPAIDSAVQASTTAVQQAYEQALAAKSLADYQPQTLQVFAGVSGGGNYCWIDPGWNHAQSCPALTPTLQNGRLQDNVEYSFAGSSGPVAFVVRTQGYCGAASPLWVKSSAGDVYLVTQSVSPGPGSAEYTVCGCHFTCGGAEQAPEQILYLLPHPGSFKGPLTVPFTAPWVTMQYDMLNHTTPGPAQTCPAPA